jgi:hypothetical protein
VVIDIGQQRDIKGARLKGKSFGTTADVRGLRMPPSDRGYSAHSARRLNAGDHHTKPLSHEDSEAPGTRADIKDSPYPTEVRLEG